jgi:hypothetical protein
MSRKDRTALGKCSIANSMSPSITHFRNRIMSQILQRLSLSAPGKIEFAAMPV